MYTFRNEFTWDRNDFVDSHFCAQPKREKGELLHLFLGYYQLAKPNYFQLYRNVCGTKKTTPKTISRRIWPTNNCNNHITWTEFVLVIVHLWIISWFFYYIESYSSANIHLFNRMSCIINSPDDPEIHLVLVDSLCAFTCGFMVFDSVFGH